MKRAVLCILFATAPLLGASSLGSFEATCSASSCDGSYIGSTSFDFSVPFPSGRASNQAADPSFPYTPFLDHYGIGTNGGSFMSGGNVCNYDVVLRGGNCDGEVSFGVSFGPPSDTGLAPGTVVTVRGMGTAEGTYCWETSCPDSGPPPPLFNLNVFATYEFTLTDPGTLYPFTWTGAQFTSVPEPETFWTIFGLAGIATAWSGRRRRARSKRVV